MRGIDVAFLNKSEKRWLPSGHASVFASTSLRSPNWLDRLDIYTKVENSEAESLGKCSQHTLWVSICDPEMEIRILLHVIKLNRTHTHVRANDPEEEMMLDSPFLILLPTHLSLPRRDLVLSSHNHWAVQVWASTMLWVLMPSTSFTQYD